MLMRDIPPQPTAIYSPAGAFGARGMDGRLHCGWVSSGERMVDTPSFYTSASHPLEHL